MENVSTERSSIRMAVKETLGNEQCVITVTVRKGETVKQRQLTRWDLLVTDSVIADFSSITGVPIVLFTKQEIRKVDYSRDSIAFTLKNDCIWTISKAKKSSDYRALYFNKTKTGFENAAYIKQGSLYILDLTRSFIGSGKKEELFSNSPFNFLRDSTTTQHYLTLCYVEKTGTYSVGLWDTVNSRQATTLLRLTPKDT